MVSILGHVWFYIIKHEQRGNGNVPFLVLTRLDKRKKMADHEVYAMGILAHSSFLLYGKH